MKEDKWLRCVFTSKFLNLYDILRVFLRQLHFLLSLIIKHCKYYAFSVLKILNASPMNYSNNQLFLLNKLFKCAN